MGDDKMNIGKNVKKFGVQNKNMIVALILVAFAIAVYFFINYQTNLMQEQINIAAYADNSIRSNSSTLELKQIAKLNTLKDVILVFISLILSSFLSALFIDIKNKNKMLDEWMANDIISSDKIIDSLVPESKDNLLSKLESEKYFNSNAIFSDMYSSVRNTLIEENEFYYYNRAEYIVTCDIQKEYIEKTIKKVMRIYAVEDKCVINNFPLARSCVFDSGKYVVFTLNKISLNGKAVARDNYTVNKEQIESGSDSLEDKCGYNSRTVVSMNKIHLNSKSPTDIIIEYTTRVPLNDTVYTARINAPCKEFELTFSVTDSNSDYKVVGSPFGFVDCSQNTPNTNKDDLFRAKFKNWVFKNDGVCINIIKNDVFYQYKFIIYHESLSKLLIFCITLAYCSTIEYNINA